MDVKLSGGDVWLNMSGATEYLSAAEEAAQRVLIAALTAKGGFRYNRSLGTEYPPLGDQTRLKDELDMLIREAAAGIAGTDVTVTAADAGEQRAVIRIAHGGETITTEVDLHGNI